jgi:hypothetical protein
MSADKRSVTTDALDTLGTIITENEKRDAIHLAVDNAVAGEKLAPGEDVGFLPDGTFGSCDNPIGIVDPFLKKPVKKGQRFWIVIYPRKITSLRHVWEHPDFPDRTQEAVKVVEPVKVKSESEIWMENEADRLGVGYQELLDRARIYVKHGEYWSEGGRFEGENVSEGFWKHYSAITGESVSHGDGGYDESFFSCSC